MKRLTLEIDLSENEIFDEEVTKAIRAKVREAVRNARNEDIDNEVQQEVERLFDGGSWEEKKDPTGAVVHTLVFGHHGDEPKVIVALFRDSEGDWFTTSNVLDTYWDLLTGKEMCEHDAKMMVEEMVYDHFADEKRYYEEICEELDMEN